MMENFGLAIMLEVPCVLVNVQRGGPSTGLPTLPGQADMMQARWGSHGDYEVIALCPKSPQECFEHTIDAFNLSEEYRMPVFVMMDECVGHMTERVVIPPAGRIDITPRRYTRRPPGKAWPYETDRHPIPPMLPTGEGYNYHVTGLTHDYRGYPVITPEAQEENVRRLVDKVMKNTDKIIRLEENGTEDADVVVVAYGITARVVEPAVLRARSEGIKVGMLRLITAWPFCEDRIRELAENVKAFVVPELNYGQIFYEVERCAAGKAACKLVGHAGGTVHDYETVYQAILEVLR
jgi:2-oxoglutarate ferredoxin oxidoreductase subunit alpha